MKNAYLYYNLMIDLTKFILIHCILAFFFRAKIWIFNYQEGSWDPINELTPVACIYVCTYSKIEHRFPRLYFHGIFLTWETIDVCFIDIGRIVDHHCLNFLFIIHPLLSLLSQDTKMYNVVEKESGSIVLARA